MITLTFVVERTVRIRFCIKERDSFFDIYRVNIECNSLYTDMERLTYWN